MQRPPDLPSEKDQLSANYKAGQVFPYEMTLKEFQKMDLRETKNLALATASKNDFFDKGANNLDQGTQQLAKDLARDLSVNGEIQPTLVELKQKQNFTHEELKEPTRTHLTRLFKVDVNPLYLGYSQGPASFIPFLLGSATGDKYKILQPQVRMNNLFYDPKSKKFYLDFYAESFRIDGEIKGVLPAKIKARFVFTSKGLVQKDWGCELVSVATDSAEVFVMLKGHTYDDVTFPQAFARYIHSTKNNVDTTQFSTPSVAVMQHYIKLLELINAYKIYALKKLAKFKLSEEQIKELAQKITANEEINIPLAKENIDLCRKYAIADKYLEALIANMPFEERFKHLRTICQTTLAFMSQHRDNRLFAAKGSRLIADIIKELEGLDIVMPNHGARLP